MNVSAWRAVRSASKHIHTYPCRHVGGRRLLNFAIHTSSYRRRENDPSSTPSQTSDNVVEVPPETENIIEDQSKVTSGPEGPSGRPSKPKDASNYGSASRRAGRNMKRPKELPQVYIPPWFMERNVFLEDAPDQSQEAASPPESAIPAADAKREAESQTENRSHEPHQDSQENEADAGSANHLKIASNVAEEISSLIQAGLRVPQPQHAESVASIRPHLVLSSPRPGGSSYLDTFVNSIARSSDADVLRLNAQDIAEIGGDYMEPAASFRSNTLSSLGYDTARVGDARPPPPAEEGQEEEEEYEEGGEGDTQEFQDSPRGLPTGRLGAMSVSIIPGGSFDLGSLGKLLKFPLQEGGDGSSDPTKSASAGKTTLQVKDNTQDMKMAMLTETLLNVPEMKRVTGPIASQEAGTADSSQPAESATPESAHPQLHQTERGSNSLIVLVEDYPQINMTIQGNKFLSKLHEIVGMRRTEGQSVLIVGTASFQQGLASRDHKAAVDEAQNQPYGGPTRTVIVPVKDRSADGRMWHEHKQRIKGINIRHLRDMLRRIAPVFEQVSAIVDDWDLDLQSEWAYVAGLDISIWPLEKVNRIAVVALGILKNSDNMTSQTIEAALSIIDASDSSKYKWYKKHMHKKQKGSEESVISAASTQAQSEERMKNLRKKCNTYEKKLLSGVVDAKNIRTTFADVQAPRETIDALKTLTSLSLVRPDAFTYGVLATDRIPGLLLYGPPGTGKTLLAKAVAKESGATVLEVSGSDVYDMYVGEGEKNVRAIFTLAKKLSPCIIFIDEADAILGSRSGGHARTSHRELINQFLREWDGMTDMNAFIMVATNRPFDLDEASLRRLPRRLLVDLPVEKDREAILKIHLKDELLDSEVSIQHLASQTPFYSGSDLKNLCVAAALACVREEFEFATAYKKEAPEEKYQYAEKRTLHPRHFTKAMEEISASISEDMGSLSAIRKFDEKYGDRRGRRKKLGGYGFKTIDDSEKLGSDNARVRNRT